LSVSGVIAFRFHMFMPLLRSPWRAPVPTGDEPTSSLTNEGGP